MLPICCRKNDHRPGLTSPKYCLEGVKIQCEGSILKLRSLENCIDVFGAHYLEVCSHNFAARVRAGIRARVRASAKRNNRNNSISQAGKEPPWTHATIGVSQLRSYPIRHVPCEARFIVGIPFVVLHHYCSDTGPMGLLVWVPAHSFSNANF